MLGQFGRQFLPAPVRITVTATKRKLPFHFVERTSCGPSQWIPRSLLQRCWIPPQIIGSLADSKHIAPAWEDIGYQFWPRRILLFLKRRVLFNPQAWALLTPSIGSDVSILQSKQSQTDELIGPTFPDQETPGHQTTLNSGSTVLNWDTGADRSYIIPMGEFFAYLFLLSVYDRHLTEPTAVYRTD